MGHIGHTRTLNFGGHRRFMAYGGTDVDQHSIFTGILFRRRELFELQDRQKRRATPNAQKRITSAARESTPKSTVCMPSNSVRP